MEKVDLQAIDPIVTRTKFERELSQFLSVENEWRSKGVIKLSVDYPVVEFAFIAKELKPQAIAFAVSIDFTNYDLEPPSVKFINCLTRQPVSTEGVYVKFVQVNRTIIPGPMGPILNVQSQGILVGEPKDLPFLCIPGTREYHNHPAHTGNPWLLHRNRGEGKLGFLLDQLYNHSMPYIKGFGLNLSVVINQQA